MSILFEPLKINTMQIPNRFMRSATHDRCADPSGGVTDLLIRIYKRLAMGGVGLITTGHAYVSGNGKMSSNMLGADRDELIPGLKKLVDSVHRYDSKIMLELNHAGRYATTAMIGEQPAAPSAVYNPITDETPRAFDQDEIKRLIEAYAAAANRAVSAGFDAVQIHSAHGYLASQFISPYTNRRNDHWGGTLENRMRFLLEVFHQIRKTVGDDYPVTVKLNSEDFIDGGLTIEESTQIAGALSQAGIDAIEISGGMMRESLVSGSKLDILTEEDEAYFLPNARKFKSVITAPLILVGGLRSPQLMQRLIEDCEVDMVSMCRPLIREPDIVNQWKQGNFKKAGCISCGGCQKYLDEPVRCVLL
jgi:2,4-dienoyl-CoA reductase-like NADH-dependent reductase (Old Yellow Enzyme family)